jgi:transcription antitermination factor NusG
VPNDWFVGRTQSQRERWAAENCRRQGAETYLPFIVERDVVVRGRLIKSRLRPLFPGYLFILVPSGQWHFLNGTFGLIGLIQSGLQPATISETIIEDLRQREVDDAVQLPEYQRRQFTKYDAVRISEGPFEGRCGLVDGYTDSERVHVLLDLLGRKVPLLFAEGQLAAA